MKALYNRGTFVVTNLIAELLVAISSKGHGHGVVSDRSVDCTVLSMAADVIAKEPPQMQQELIDHVARFLGRADTLAMKDTEVKAILNEQVEVMRKNPWAMAKPVEASAPQLEQPSHPVETQQQPARAASTAWQTKIAEKPAASAHLSA